MARQKLPGLHRSSPRKRPTPKRSVLHTIHNPDSIPRIFIPTRHGLQNLPVIHEEPYETENRRGRSDCDHCNPHTNARDEDEDDDNEDDWYEDDTLVAMLQEECPEFSDDDKLAALAEKLRVPMIAQSKTFRRHFMDTLVPALKRVKEVHLTLEKNVDTKLAQGIVGFDDACQKMEAMAIKEEEEFEAAYDTSKGNIRKLFGQVQEAYGRRDALHADFQRKINETADAAIADLMTLPAELERLQSGLEKKSKILNNKDDTGSAKEMEKIFKTFMGTL